MLAKKRKCVPSSETNGSNNSSESKGFVEGSIVRIRLENFVTYDSLESYPGPGLNVIIGPNGTGKSTIVCAICLGLAGKPAVLGRQTHVSEFIKHGCERAEIEIELFDPKGHNKTIKREIRQNGSNWFVNNGPTTQKAVEALIAGLNIQVNNLCQFLPQDKVADFAKMTKEKLLESTEQAVGPPGMFENHEKLKNFGGNLKDKERRYNELKEELEKAISENIRLEPNVKNYEDRQRHLDKVKILEKKKHWVEYEDQRRAYITAKEEKDRLAKRVKVAELKHKPMRAKLDKCSQMIKRCEDEKIKMTDDIKQQAVKAQQSSKAIESETDKLAEIQQDEELKISADIEKKKKIKQLKRHLEGLQNDLSNLPESQNFQPEIERNTEAQRGIAGHIRRIHTQCQDVEHQLRTKKGEKQAIDHELAEIKNINNQRLNLLRQKHRDTYEAVMWLRQNSHLFKKKIHEPLMITLNVNDPKWAKYLEMHISFNDMRAFVCEDKADSEVFFKEVKDNQKLRINAIIAPDKHPDEFEPPQHINTLRRYGFHSYLREMFNCPTAVMSYLCEMYKVHAIPVGDHTTKQRVEKVVNEVPRLSTFYTENHQYAIRTSRYDKSKSSRCSEIRKPNLLTVTVDENRERELTQLLREILGTCHDYEEVLRKHQLDLGGLEKQLEALRTEKKALLQKRDQRKSLENQITSKKQSIIRYERELIDIDQERRAFAKKVQDINQRKVGNLLKMRTFTQSCAELSIQKTRTCLRLAEQLKNKFKMENDMRDATQELEQMRNQLDETKESLDTLKASARRLLVAAKKICNMGENEELSNDMKKAFERCPDNMEEIDAAIHEAKARADCIFSTSEEVVHEYEKGKKYIAKTEKECKELKARLDDMQEDIEKVREEWLTPLNELLEQINKSFSYFFKTMNCAGEVDLYEPENKEEYHNYGVRIKVKYRASESLRELTGHYQSGGERSVATILYMMALQEITKCPFRCVDEINQGMDPANERRVFDLVVQTACKKDTSQYFLLTPKLLSNLSFSDNMTVLCVFNGPSMLHHKDWNMKKFFKRLCHIFEKPMSYI
ncbi:unnamed protein product [Owenia fusiformis]|uniref:Structural maintenance of chromosomes protein 5 n=1 Tax=Owenia fusiformis TaxID=6347 RepID=A0A8S4PXH0_OWEFU|nr:unnamed protein product [Owenia fusiformis]